MNFTFFSRTFCEIHRVRSCHLRDTNVTILSQTRHENNRSENDDFFVFFRKICEIHRFRSCHFRDTNVTKFVQTRHENNRSCYDEFHSFFSKKIVKFIITAPVIFVTRISRLCHNRDMKITGAKTMNFAFFRTISEIHRFRSC